MLWRPYLAVLLFVAAVSIGSRSPAQELPSVSTVVHVPADSLYSLIRVRLAEQNYRLVEVDAASLRLVVRLPNEDTRVQLLFVSQGDSTVLTVTPIDVEDLAIGISAVIVTTNNATAELSVGTPAGVPPSRWRSELFVSPFGGLWLARSGLYYADSAGAPWKLAFGKPGDPVEADELRIGLNMAFVNDSTMLVGLPNRGAGKDNTLTYRTADGGRTWSPVPLDGISMVDDMAAMGKSVWLLGTRWEGQERRGTFLRSLDAGLTWQRQILPADLNDVTRVYRTSSSTAYVAAAGYNDGPVFWSTTNGGDSWTEIPTPHDQGIHDVPSYGVRVQEIATVGEWLLVREYGTVFATRPDSIAWERLDGIEHVAADLERDQVFALTDSLQAAVLGRELTVLWRSIETIPDSRPSTIERVLARDGIGYVLVTGGSIYEAHSGILQLIQQRSSSP